MNIRGPLKYLAATAVAASLVTRLGADLKLPEPPSEPISYQEARERVAEAHQQEVSSFENHPEGLSLNQQCHPLALLHPEPPQHGTVVLFHGYTPCSWQVRHQADRLYQEGFNVIAPRLPGHGVMDQDGDFFHQALPGGHQWRRYLETADQAVEQARELGGEVAVAGLSMGGALAFYAAGSPGVTRAIAFAPFFHLPHPAINAVARTLEGLDLLTFDRATLGLGQIPIGWGDSPTMGEQWPGYCDFKLGKLMAADRAAQASVRRSPQLPAGNFQFFLTEADPPAMNRVAEGLCERSQGWVVRFDDDVPHAMIHPAQADPEFTDHLLERTVAYLKTGQGQGEQCQGPWREPAAPDIHHDYHFR